LDEQVLPERQRFGFDRITLGDLSLVFGDEHLDDFEKPSTELIVDGVVGIGAHR
jgi:hypothetical protein